MSISTYGYQSVNLSGYDIGWEDSKWVVEIWREGVLIHTVCSDSPNVTGNSRVQLPDGSKQYGKGLWWWRLILAEEIIVGDIWKVYGWEDGLVPPEYPVNRT
jgi:hypothetical protein